MVGAPPEAPVVGVRFDDATSTTMRTGLTLTHKGAVVPVSMWATDFHAAYGEGDPAVRALQRRRSSRPEGSREGPGRPA